MDDSVSCKAMEKECYVEKKKWITTSCYYTPFLYLVITIIKIAQRNLLSIGSAGYLGGVT